jgi:hypothetical protein
VEARITLRTGNKVHLGILTDDLPAPTPGDPIVTLEEYPETVFGPDDLPPDHLIIVHGPKKDTWDLVHTAVEVGFTVAWEREQEK